jgi:ABC-type multidrug transport system ATPase subunit
MAAALELDGVWKFYGDYPALNNFSLSVSEGQCCALLGRNGAGKTTLLRVLAGLSPFQRGTVKFPNRQHVGFLGHGIGVYEDLTARANVSGN